MTAAFVQSVGGQTTTLQSTLGIALTGVAAGNHLTSLVGAWRGATYGLTATTSTPSATWANAQASDVWNSSAGNFFGVRIDYSENVASGSWTVTQNADNTLFHTGCAVESSGVATTASLGNHPGTTHQTASVSATPPAQTPTAGSIVLTWMVNSGTINTADTLNAGGQTGNFTATPAGGASTCWDGANQRGGGAYHNNVSAASTQPQYTEASGTPVWNITQVEFKAAAGGSTGPPIRRRPYRFFRRAA